MTSLGQNTTVVCRNIPHCPYWPRKCKFQHPPCRHGEQCKNKTACQFTHPGQSNTPPTNKPSKKPHPKPHPQIKPPDTSIELTKIESPKTVLHCILYRYQHIPVELRKIVDRYLWMNLNDSNIKQAVRDWTITEGLYCYDGHPNKTISTKTYKTMLRTKQNALFQYGHISDWNTSAVTSIEGLFRRCYRFNDNINDWDVSNVTNMCNVFFEATLFNQPLNDWDMRNVTEVCSMFNEARSFNQPLDKWNMSKVSNTSQLFYCATSFNQPIHTWNVSSVIHMNQMFESADQFNQPLNHWNVCNVMDMSHMFQFATAFNQSLNDWDVSNVKYMDGIFTNAADFNQSLDQWDVSNVVTDLCRYALFGDCHDNFQQNPPKGIDIHFWNSEWDL